MNATTAALLVLVAVLIAVIATQRMRLAAQRRTIHRLRVAESKHQERLERTFESDLAAGIHAYTREVADRINPPPQLGTFDYAGDATILGLKKSTTIHGDQPTTRARATLSQNSTNGKTPPQPRKRKA